MSYWFNLYLMANFLILQLYLLQPFTLVFMLFKLLVDGFCIVC